MRDLELTRAKGDRRLYELESVGTLRVTGWTSRGASAQADGRTWQISRRGFLRPVVEATDAAGTAVGAFTPERRRRGGTLQWGGVAFALRPASRWRERYALVDVKSGELAVFEAKGWGRRPVKVTIDESAPVEPGLLLFAAFVVKGLAEDAAGAAAGAAAATT